MPRIVVLSGLLLAGLAARAMAGPYTEFSGKVQSVDAEKLTITLSIDEQARTFACVKGVKVYRLKGGKKPSAQLQEAGLKAIQPGDTVTLTTHKENDQDVAGAIRIAAPAKKPKK